MLIRRIVLVNKRTNYPIRNAACKFSSKDNSKDEEKPRKGRLAKWFNRIVDSTSKLAIKTGIVEDEAVAHFIGNAVAVSVYGMAGAMLLGTVGVDTSPVVAGLGVTGVTAGFAVKEIATNALAGAMLVVSKPFVKGQFIQAVGHNIGVIQGEVMSIEIRYVVLKTTQGILKVPSNILYSNAVLIISDVPPPPPSDASPLK